MAFRVTLPALKPEARAVMLSLAEYQGVSMVDLLKMAHELPGGHRVYFPDRAAVIAFIVGTRDL